MDEQHQINMTWRLTNKCLDMSIYLTISLKASTSFSPAFSDGTDWKHSLSYNTAIAANYTRESRHWKIQQTL